MFMSKEKLAIKIAEVDCIKIDDVYLSKAGENQVLEQLTANTASTDQQYTRLRRVPLDRSPGGR